MVEALHQDIGASMGKYIWYIDLYPTMQPIAQLALNNNYTLVDSLPPNLFCEHKMTYNSS